VREREREAEQAFARGSLNLEAERGPANACARERDSSMLSEVVWNAPMSMHDIREEEEQGEVEECGFSGLTANRSRRLSLPSF
jgi:hypothetical protein